MSDLKSKLPDMNEIGKFANKLFTDVKKSVSEIMTDYKKNREGSETSCEVPKEPENTDTKKDE